MTMYESKLRAANGELFMPGCADRLIGKIVIVTDDFQSTKEGRLVRYEIKRNGREMVMIIDVDNELLSPPVTALPAQLPRSGNGARVVKPGGQKRYTGQVTR